METIKYARMEWHRKEFLDGYQYDLILLPDTVIATVGCIQNKSDNKWYTQLINKPIFVYDSLEEAKKGVEKRLCVKEINY